jgi:hypothetical protein
MTETDAIFDDTILDIRHLNMDEIHERRVKKEALVYGILKAKYGDELERYFLSNAPPKSGNKCIFIIERRIHPNLVFLLHNIAYFGRDWCIGFICSDVNLDYCKAICGPHTDSIHFLPLFKGSPDRDTARRNYNTLLKSPEFYEGLAHEHLCFVQTDTYFKRHIPNEILEYDYVGAITAWNYNTMVGGLTFRKKTSMIKICREAPEDYPSEDFHINAGAKHFGMKMPLFLNEDCTITESFFQKNALGIHQWWTFYSKDINNSLEIFNEMFFLETESQMF